MFTLKDLSLMCGLSERTLRNYLKMGILTGEKKEGVWTFCKEDIEKMFKNPFAKGAIKATKKAIFFDFVNEKHTKNSACIILDLPEQSAFKTSAFFCNAVNKRTGLKMRFDSEGGTNRVVLSGDEKTVFDVLKEYHEELD